MNTNAMRALAISLAVMMSPAVAGDSPEQDRIDRGRYIVTVGACNDCHTPGFPESAGTTPVSDWLTGNPVGFQGPWGTTYPRNLRLFVQDLTEAEWLATTRQPKRPPMPWFVLRDMSDEDLSAIYHFIRSLGPKGTWEPAYADPGVAVTTPYIELFPKNLPQVQAHAQAKH